MKQLSIINYQLSIILLLLLCGNLVMAQEELVKSEYSYRRYTIHDGLPDMCNATLYQDTKGFIWIGTFNGFARYDGYTFQSFLANLDIGINRISEDVKGNISGISLNGINTVYLGSDTVHTHLITISEDGLYSFFISKSMPVGYGIYQNGNTKAVYAFSDSGLVKIWTHEKLNNVRDYKKPFWDKNGKRFLIPTNEGTYVIGENGTVIDSFAVNTINCFIPYKGGFRAVADDGIYEYDNHELKRIFEYPFINSDMSDYSIMEDVNGNYIIRTKNTVFRYAGGKLETIASNLPLTNDIFLDKEGNLWVGTDEGLYNFYGLNFKNHTLSSKENTIRSVNVDNQNRTWLASALGDLLVLDNGETKKMNYPTSPYNNSLNFASMFNGDDFYISGGGGILHHNIKLGTFDWLDLPPDGYAHIVLLPDGDLAVGTYDIMYIYRTGKGIIRQYDISETKQRNSSVTVDKQGRLLLGGSSGITIIDGDSIQHIQDEKLKPGRNMMYDRSGTLWLTARTNLVSMRGDTPTVVHTFPKLIRSLHITRNNIMVVATTDAVYLSKNAENNVNFVRYDQYNGFNFIGTLISSMAEDEKGNVWLLTQDGAVYFNPDELLRKQPVPLLYVQSMQSSVNNIAWKDVEDPHSHLKHNNNNIKFNPVALCYSSTGNVRYHYRLIGFQDEWSEPTKNREVTFNNLPPGNYMFEIYADAGTDESRSEIQSIAFSIKPAFWQTAWFLVACIASLMLASAGIALYIQRKKNKALLEKLRAEKELNELRISSIRLKAIPHFNANVLAAIEYYIANRTKEEAMRILGIYSDFTYKTLSEVDKASRPLSEELAYVKMYLDLEKIRFLDKFDFQIKVEDEVDKNVQLPNMILHTYCENAVKHGLMPLKSGGLLTIQVSQHNNIVCVSVEDNGVGRSYAAQNPQLHSSKQGLSILNRQIEIYNRFNSEKINHQVKDLFENEKPCGTLFSVEVPLEFEYII